MGEAAYGKLVDYLRETATLQSTLRLLGWDQQVFMPEGGAELRGNQMAQISGLVHRRRSSPEYKQRIEDARAFVDGQDPHSVAAANVREADREYDRATRVPAELVEERARISALARPAWVEARSKRDFSLFQPHLENVVDLSRRWADALGWDAERYDALLDVYERGLTSAGVEAVFTPLKQAHVALLQRIQGSGVEIDTSCLRRSYPRPAQEAFVRMACAEIGFDFSAGRLDPTVHPFCSGQGPGDVRLTTRFDESDFSDCFFSSLHEAGHGLYEQGLVAEHYGTPAGVSCSFGVHESQSRMWENFVGRSRGFWQHFHSKAQAAFPESLGDVDVDGIWRAVNEVKPSFIRVDADEVTYNLHIMLRFEMERAMIAGDLAVADVPAAWNDKMEASFGIRPSHDGEGCLQDIHWSGGLMGYFPSYTFGNVYAAQIWQKACADLGDLEAQFASGEFSTLLGWLREKVHALGKRYEPIDLVEHVTGSRPSSQPLIDHLEAKFTDVYGL